MKTPPKRKLFVCASILACALCYLWLSFGVYSDREFGGMHFFRKHQVSTRFYFYSPHGESDEPDVTDAEISAEKDYREFVELKGARSRRWTLFK